MACHSGQEYEVLYDTSESRQEQRKTIRLLRTASDLSSTVKSRVYSTFALVSGDDSGGSGGALQSTILYDEARILPSIRA